MHELDSINKRDVNGISPNEFNNWQNMKLSNVIINDNNKKKIASITNLSSIKASPSLTPNLSLTHLLNSEDIKFYDSEISKAGSNKKFNPSSDKTKK